MGRIGKTWAGGGGVQRPVLNVNELKKMGAWRGQNLLLLWPSRPRIICLFGLHSSDPRSVGFLKLLMGSMYSPELLILRFLNIKLSSFGLFRFPYPNTLDLPSDPL